MVTLNDHTPDIKTVKSAVWFITILSSVIFFPILRNIILSVLLKLYDLFVQHGMGG